MAAQRQRSGPESFLHNFKKFNQKIVGSVSALVEKKNK